MCVWPQYLASFLCPVGCVWRQIKGRRERAGGDIEEVGGWVDLGFWLKYSLRHILRESQSIILVSREASRILNNSPALL